MCPSVSCLCPTYGRTRLLEESIESFLRQDYGGETELVIVNDCPAQELSFSGDDCIRVINLPERCKNLGEKRNATANLARMDLLITWSDDDVFLPWRISENVKTFEQGSYVTEGSHFFDDGKQITLKSHAPCGPFLMSRSDFWRLGGIPQMDAGEDQGFLATVRKSLRVTPTQRTSLLYRWATGHYHISALPRKLEGGEWEAARLNVEAKIAQGKEPKGKIVLRPTWRRDYIALCSSAN